MAQDELAKAGFPGGKGFPPIEIWYREQGGYNDAIAAPMLQYLQAQFKHILGIDMGIKSMPTKDWSALSRPERTTSSWRRTSTTISIDAEGSDLGPCITPFAWSKPSQRWSMYSESGAGRPQYRHNPQVTKSAAWMQRLALESAKNGTSDRWVRRPIRPATIRQRAAQL